MIYFLSKKLIILEFILNSFVQKISKPSKYKVLDTFKILHSKLTLLKRINQSTNLRIVY